MMKKRLLASAMLLVSGYAMAAVPVVEKSQEYHAAVTGTPTPQSVINRAYPSSTDTDMSYVSTSSLSLEQRVARVEQQMANLNSMHVDKQLGEMQDALQKVQGDLEVQRHDIKLLQEQQQRFYQDANRRLTQLEAAGGGSAATTAASASELKAYNAASDLLRGQKYDQALESFKDFVKQYPSSTYVPNALYWEGEIYLLQGDLSPASKAFNNVITDHSASNKAPDAMLKLSKIYKMQGDKDKAAAMVQQLKTQFPNSSAAKVAR